MSPAIHQHTPEWYAWHRDHITATTAAVIAGEKGSVLEEWARMRGLVDEPVFDAETRALMDEGLAIQPYLIDFYRRRTGRKVRNIDTVRTSKAWPVAGFSPDGDVVGEPVGLEAKMSTAARWRGLSEDVPGDVYAQVQWQMFVAGWERVDVVALLFGRPKVIEVPRDDEYIADLVALARQFWGWVQSGERPPVDGSENARRVISALHPANDGAGLLEAPSDVATLVRELADRKAQAKDAENAIGTAENALRALIGDADGFRGDFGTVTWKRNGDSSRTNWPAVAKAYRRLLEAQVGAVEPPLSPEESAVAGRLSCADLDGIQSIHTETVAGPRVLRLALKENA